MEFEDRKAFEAWLKEQSQEVCVAIATRAALRVWLFIVAPRFWKATDEARKVQQSLVLLTARCNLISGVTSTNPTPEIGIAANAATHAAAFGANANAAAGAANANAANAANAAANAATNAANAAANAATNAANAADAAAIAATNATNATFAALAADAAYAAAAAFAADAACADAALTPIAMMSTRLWHDPGPPEKLTPEDIGPTPLDTDPRFDFFRRWYDGMVRGQPLDWELQRRVALIPPDTWETGVDAVAEAIAQIEAAWGAERAGGETSAPVTEKELAVVTQRVSLNRDALAVSSASLLEQLDAFRERVRGMNALDQDLRDEILGFVDHFRGQLEALLHDLPPPGEAVGEERSNRLALWLRGYRTVLMTKLAHYSSPENVGEATVPTAIILGATGVGAMMGSPLAGAAVGGLIVNQMKPGQAAKELMKPDVGADVGTP
ncbi:hypothetical protein [Maliponia aquimaris]|uniref:hypothetical protein n=1 Tax=Maliponia aquimaris TaxID=1673631 RepID=UPI000B8B0564|nr:hypothetical protein [Maliponia aquimaris]